MSEPVPTCQKCEKVEPYRLCSRIGNDLMVWLCEPCHRQFLKTVRRWVGVATTPIPLKAP